MIVVITIALIMMLLLHGAVSLLWKKFDSNFFTRKIADMSILLFAPLLEYMPKFANIHASLITKFVVFVILTLISHFVTAIVSIVIITLLTTMEIIKWSARKIQLNTEERPNFREALMPIYRACSVLLIYQIILNVLLIFM